MIDNKSFFSPLRILLVEDSEDDVIAFSRALDKGGLETKITHFLRAEEAMESLILSPAPYDLVVTDYKLPGLTGLELCKRIIALNIPLPCIIVTGAGAEHIAVEALKAGVFDYLVKDLQQNYLQILPLLLPEVVKKFKQKQTALIFERERQAVAAISELFLAPGHGQDMIYKNFSQILAAEFSFPISLVLLLAENKKEMIVKGVTGNVDQKYLGAILPLQKTVCGITIVSGQPMLLTDIVANPEMHCFMTGSNIETCLSVPIKGKRSGVIGAMILSDTKNRYDADIHIPALQIIANHLGQEIERRQAEKKLRESELVIRRGKEHWEKTFDAMSDFVTIQDKEMRIVRANKATHEFFQVKYGELNGKHCYELFTGCSEPCQRCPLSDTIHDIGKHSEIIEHENLGRIFQVSSSPILDKNGEIQYLVHIARDVTEQKKQEQLLLQLSVQKEQLKRFESLNTMAGAIAHRFNNAMMAVQGNLDLMLNSLADNSEEREMAFDALHAAEGASLVGSMMLSYVGQRPLQREVASFSDLVSESATELKSQLGPSISLKYIPSAEPLYCSMDQQQIKEVTRSIITNAFESLKDETGEVEISFGTDHFEASSFPIAFQGQGTENGVYTFCQVRDTGQGISRENLQRIFEPFFTTKFVGRGLGLSMSVGIMRSHRGTVLVESSPGVGTAVRILLPAIESFQKRVESPFGSKEDSLKLSGDILFADDDDSVRDIGKRMLASLGFTVHTAANGLEAVEMVNRKDVDYRIVIMDISMPEMDGIEAMKEIRKGNADLSILLCSGYSEEKFFLDTDLANRPDGFLQKPFLLSDLSKSIEKLLY